MKNRNIINSSDANEGNNTSAWDNLGGDSSLPSEEYFESQPSYSSNEEIVAGAVEAEKNAVEYGEGAKIGEDFAHSLIEMVQSGQMSKDEARSIYENLKNSKKEREEAVEKEVSEKRGEEKKYEQERRKNLLEKINKHPVAQKVISGVMSVAILAGGFMAAKKIASNKTNEATNSSVVQETVNYNSNTITPEADDSIIEDNNVEGESSESEGGGAENNDGELESDDEFETMANGVRYAKDAYSDEKRDKKYDFTNDFQECYGDEQATKDAMRKNVESNPTYLVGWFGKLPDNLKGEYAGKSDTVLNNMVNGENGAELQRFMLETMKQEIKNGNPIFTTASGGEAVSIEYQILDKGKKSTPADVRLAYREATLKENDKIVKFVLSDGVTEIVFDDDCGNIIIMNSSTMKEDGHVEITEGNSTEDPTPDPEPDPTPEDPTPEDPTPEDPTPEDPTPEDPTPEDPTPEDPTPEDPTPEDPTPEDPTPEDPAPKDEENLKRIDEQINDDIAEDIGTKEIVITPTEDVVEEEGEATEAPIEISDGGGTEHKEFEQNDDSKEAEKVDQEQIKEDGNDYSEDKGGAHDDEYAPVKDDHEAQEEADKKAGLEENNGGLTDEEINELYDKYFPKEEDGEKEDGDGGDTEDDEMDADQKYKEAIAAKNKEEAENLSDEELEDIYKDLGL